ncbi:nucleotidyltransferase domain-containing protein [Candidatus Peregrinibacteria bacterium]|nr:nucleotidyltransferase domain-containing protein [Candidatus Peregrinibacteria bacterium]
MTIQVIKKRIIPILKSQGVTKAAIFGSFATGNEKKTSDLDLLVKFSKTIGLLELAHLKTTLEASINRKVCTNENDAGCYH